MLNCAKKIIYKMTCLAPITPTNQEFQYPFNKIMHRCAGNDAPENTLAAIKFGLEIHNNRAIEFDVQLSRDGVPILMHDETLSRTTSFGGSDLVKNISHNTLSGLDAGSWFDEIKYRNERIPLFTEVVDYCKTNAVWMNIELKGSDADVRSDDRRMDLIGRTVASHTSSLFREELDKDVLDYTVIPLFSSFSVAALVAAKEVAPTIPRALLVKFKEDVPNLIEVLQTLEANAVHLCDDDILEYDLVSLKSAGFKIMCYTVNTPERVDLLRSLGIDAVCTDNFAVTGDRIKSI